MPSLHNRRSVLATTGIVLTTGCMSVVEPSESGTSTGKSKLTPRWDREILGNTFRPIVRDGVIYVSGNKAVKDNIEGFVVAVSLDNGSKLFELESLNEILGPIIINDGFGYISTTNGELTAIDLESQSENWTLTCSESFTTVPQSHGDKLYVGTSSGRVLAINLQEGKILWQIHTSESDARATVVNQSVFVTTASKQDGKSYIRMFDTLSQGKVWEQTTKTTPLTRVTVEENYVFSAAIHGQSGLIAIDSASGDSVSSKYVNPASARPVSSDGSIFLSHLSGISAFDAKSREIRWQVLPPETRVESAPAVSDKSVFVTTNGGSKNKVAMIDSTSGDIEGEYSIPDNQEPSEPAYHDGAIVYSAIEDGEKSQIYCIDVN